MNTIHNKVYSNSGNSDVLKNIVSSVNKILDVGCGRGDNAKHLWKKGLIIDGITLSEEEAKHAKSFMRNIFLHNLEYGLPKDSLSDKYDAIICSHVLEHICYP